MSTNMRDAMRRLLALCLLAVPLAAPAQESIPAAEVALSHDAPVQLLGKLKGTQRDAQDYIVHLEAGDTLDVALKASAASSTAFNVLSPGSETALYVGMIEGEMHWMHEVEQAGNYTVRVYLIRAAARQGTSSRYTLTLIRR
ncbi:hypothetical protein [Oxalicibacterium solurbis]|uniref:DNA breaking-rejoining protein n=1 Tax=Oxalicibacterium solurbis TaxID=69280 RepID=A0A8J3F7N6_9BURK|nr:hypothetical protein [Oxalicibacterium solurbis]GGI55591.1 hypothetical protein GCM10011430_27650 [Oxalicibacterium solurbis]